MLDGLLAHRRDWFEGLVKAPPPLLLLGSLLNDLKTAVLVLLGNVDHFPRRSLLLFALGLRWLERSEL